MDVKHKTATIASMMLNSMGFPFQNFNSDFDILLPKDSEVCKGLYTLSYRPKGIRRLDGE